MKKHTKYIFIILGVVILGIIGLLITSMFTVGIGPGYADYEYKIASSCYLSRSSVYEVSVYCDGINNSISSDVTSLGWNDQYLIAMSHPVTKTDPQNPNCMNCVPDKSITYWWIQDLVNKQGYGPLSEDGFNQKEKDLGIPSIDWLSIDQAKTRGTLIDGDLKN